MRLAISNIAWDVVEDAEVSSLLRRYGVDAIDVAPGKYFPEPRNVNRSEITRVRDWWAMRSIEITGMQALLFGTVGLNLFGSRDIQAAMLEHLKEICRIGSGLGATRLVFGSPKNRDRAGLTDEQADDMATDFFRSLGDIAEAYGVLICLEPNPTCYGANFMTGSLDTARVVRQVAHKAIRMQLDIGALTINAEDPESIMSQCHDIISHIHASEPNLVPLGDRKVGHEKIATVIARYHPDAVVSIEMLTPKWESSLEAIERSLQVAQRAYRHGAAVGETQH